MFNKKFSFNCVRINNIVILTVLLLSTYIVHVDFGFSQEDDQFSTSVSLKANAGDDMSVIEGQVVTLDATKSFTEDPPIDSFSWKQVYPESPKLSLSNNNTANPSFVVPGLPVEMIFTFELEIIDDEQSDTDTVNIYVTKPDIVGPDAARNQLANLKYVLIILIMIEMEK